MATLSDRIVEILRKQPGLSDREITDLLSGPGAAQQPVNQAGRLLESRGVILRSKRSDGRIGNYLSNSNATERVKRLQSVGQNDDVLSEDATSGSWKDICTLKVGSLVFTGE